MTPLLLFDDAVRLAECASTQDVCRRLATAGAPEGTIVVADHQTAGRGRENRHWHSPAGAGLYASFLLRPRFDPSIWIAVTPLVALALAEAIDALRAPASAAPAPAAPALAGGGSHRTMIKWPNDLLGRSGKVAGILAEAAEGSVVVGIGLNLGQRREEFPPEIRERAGSLRLEGLDPVPSRDEVLWRFNESLGSAYASVHSGEIGFLRRGLLDRFFLEGRRVRISGCGPEPLEGIARSVGELGELVLETADGPRRVVSGEVVGVGPE